MTAKSEPCPRGLHEWNIPGSGERSLECGVCGRKTPITANMTAANLLSKRAKRSSRFRTVFEKGLREAHDNIRIVG